MTKIRSCAERFWRHVKKGRPDECWLWQGATAGKGYGTMAVDHTGKMDGAHRVSWMIHRGPIPEGMCICHKCDVAACVNPAHLFLGTIAANNRDMFRKGRGAHPPKLTPEQIRQIRASKLSQPKLAAKFGVHHRTIYQVLKGITYKHVR